MPHAPSAMRVHDRPSREGAWRPSLTNRTSGIIVTTSIKPRPIVGQKNAWRAYSPASTVPRVYGFASMWIVPIAAMATPMTWPSTIITPMSPLAVPTCFSGTRSGT